MKQKLLRLLGQQGGFFQSSSSVVSWVLLSQVLMFACIPFVSRIYAPEVFGVYAVYTSIMYTLNQVVGCRSELLINLPKHDIGAKDVLAASLVIVFAISVFISIALLFLTPHALAFLGIKKLYPFLWCIPVGVLIVGTRNSLLYWVMRKGRFNTVGLANFFQAPALIVVQIGFGLIAAKAGYLIAGALASWCASLLFLLVKSVNRRFISTLLARIKNTGSILKLNRHFLTHSTLSTLLLNMANYMPVVFVASAYDTKIAAWFALTMQAVYSPLDLISVSISQVYLSKGAKLLHDKPQQLSRFFVKLTGSLILLGALPMLLVAFLGGRAFQLIFGDQWYQAGVYAQVMSLMLLIRFAVISTCQNLVLLKKQGQAFIWSLFLMIFLVVSFVPAYSLTPKPKPETTLIIFSINLIIAYSIFFILNWRAARVYTRERLDGSYGKYNELTASP